MCRRWLKRVAHKPRDAALRPYNKETMATSSPFSFPSSFPEALKPPAWALEEGQRRIILLLNHVLQQEPEATVRLKRQKGKAIHAQWREFTFSLLVTPAGLFDLANPDAKPDAKPGLQLEILVQSPLEILQMLLAGNKPDVRIEGDVQLAAELNWLVDHVRWDLEEDLARLVGDVPARAIGDVVRKVVVALKGFTGKSNGPAKAAMDAAGVSDASVTSLRGRAT